MNIKVIIFVVLVILSINNHSFAEECITDINAIHNTIKNQINQFNISDKDNKITIDAVSHLGTIGAEFDISQDSVYNADGYDLVIYSYDRDEIYRIWRLEGNNNTTKKIELPYTGHFVLAVRAYNETGCSSQSISLDEEYATVKIEDTLKHRAQWIYGYLLPPNISRMDIVE